MMKQMISMLLSMVMVLSIVPAQAIAQKITEEPVELMMEPETEPAEETTAPETAEEVVAEVTASDVAMAAAISGTCGDNLTWELNDGTLTISGTGAMTNYIGSNIAPWYSHRENIQRVVVENGVTTIGWNAFFHCNNLTRAIIPDSITSIDGSAFYGCSSLTNIIIPDGVTVIGNYAFYGCGNLTSITVPDSVTSIGSYAFQGCISLYKVILPDSLTAIAEEMFSMCIELGSISIPDSVTSIDNGAFYGCSDLTRIIIPDSVTSIGTSVFEGCKKLTQVTIPKGITSIGDNTFSGCNKLTTITIPDSVTTIGTGAFRNCNNLCDVYYGSSQVQWNTLGSNVPEATYIHYNVTDSTNHWYADTLEATCTQDGYTREICSCGYERNEEIIPHQGHNFVNGICTVCGEGRAEVVYTYGQSAQIKLIEPWGLKANTKISTQAGVIDYSQLHDYGVYFIRKSALDREGVSQETITAEDIVNDPDALKKTKADGVTVSGAYLTSIYDRDLYTYELSDSVFVMYYFVTEESADPIYVPIRERNLKDLAEARKNDAANFPNEKERIVYGYMVDLFNAISDYREDYFRN